MTSPKNVESSTESPPGSIELLLPSQRQRILEMVRLLDEESNNAKEWLRASTFGGIDGASSVFGLIAGMAGAGAGIPAIALASVAAKFSGATSMSAGEFFSVLADAERVTKMFADIKKLNEEDPELRVDGLAAALIKKFGYDPDKAYKIARFNYGEAPEFGEHAHASYTMEEFADEPPSPKTAALASFGSFFTGASLSTVPYIAAALDVIPDDAALPAAAVGTALGLFGAGAYASKYSPRKWYVVGGRQVIAGTVTGGVSYAVGQGITKLAEAGGVNLEDAGLWAAALGVVVGAGVTISRKIRGRQPAREHLGEVSGGVDVQPTTRTKARADRHAELARPAQPADVSDLEEIAARVRAIADAVARARRPADPSPSAPKGVRK